MIERILKNSFYNNKVSMLIKNDKKFLCKNYFLI